jgi:branched-chain amino acid transport system ATP-binding protein
LPLNVTSCGFSSAILSQNAPISSFSVRSPTCGAPSEGRKVFPKLTVEENLELGAFTEKSKKVVRERLANVYEIFPRLLERRTQRAGLMSGGEQAMVSIGRGMMCAPKLLLIDEPSLGLSPHFVSECFRVIQLIKKQGVTVFLVEQNVHQSLDVSDYGYVLSQGRVVAAGTNSELISNPEVREAYFGENPSSK